ALHTRLADEAVLIGPPSPTESYLHSGRILAAARQTGCQAVHPGYGFLAENAGFAAAVTEAGLTFIGPSAEVIQLMGSKTTAREAMQAAGVPVVPGYHGQGGRGDEELLPAAEEIGFPLLVKAVAGGGGKGMRLVRTVAELPAALQSARREAQHAFGDERVYLEKFLTNPRHIEFQILGDAFGNVVHLFERECSIQRRHQKIVEETPSPLLAGDEALRQKMGEAAVAAGRAVNYVNAGTLEFLVDAEHNFYFLEMNTRLQVEHPITELVTGLDLVKWQLRIAAGEALPFSQANLSQRGHAIECRIYAEDPANHFLPVTGKVLRLVEPAGPGLRVDSGLASGDEVTPYYDPLLAKLIVLAENRPEASRKMAVALSQYVILGLTTNVPFLRDLITHEAFQRGETPTDFVEQHFMGWQPAPSSLDLALIAAALAEMEHEETKGRRGEEEVGDPYNPWQRLSHFRIGEGDQK
ncbi:MAG TPA: biotin carboxylase N-terminal domain-containing protein, partial [Anaerolineae bacterium]|nr:biotin carboxylase N-terminal domain-containing protein [Anaerolineae bacterium]